MDRLRLRCPITRGPRSAWIDGLAGVDILGDGQDHLTGGK